MVVLRDEAGVALAQEAWRTHGEIAIVFERQARFVCAQATAAEEHQSRCAMQGIAARLRLFWRDSLCWYS
jgi:hypothetical protein